MLVAEFKGSSCIRFYPIASSMSEALMTGDGNGGRGLDGAYRGLAVRALRCICFVRRQLTAWLNIST